MKESFDTGELQSVTQSEISDYVISRPLFGYTHKFSNIHEWARIRTALAKTWSMELNREQELRAEAAHELLDVKRRLIAFKKKRMSPGQCRLPN